MLVATVPNHLAPGLSPWPTASFPRQAIGIQSKKELPSSTGARRDAHCKCVYIPSGRSPARCARPVRAMMRLPWATIPGLLLRTALGRSPTIRLPAGQWHRHGMPHGGDVDRRGAQATAAVSEPSASSHPRCEPAMATVSASLSMWWLDARKRQASRSRPGLEHAPIADRSCGLLDGASPIGSWRPIWAPAIPGSGPSPYESVPPRTGVFPRRPMASPATILSQIGFHLVRPLAAEVRYPEVSGSGRDLR